MNLGELRVLFEAGALRDAYIVPMMNEWTVEFTRMGGDSVTLTTLHGNAVRRFKNLDTAFGQVRKVGMDRANIRMRMP